MWQRGSGESKLAFLTGSLSSLSSWDLPKKVGSVWGTVCAGGVISFLGFSSLPHHSYPAGDKGSGSFLIPMAEYSPSLESSSPFICKKKGQTELWSNIPRQISRLHYLSHSLSIGFEVRRGTWTLGVSTGPCPAARSEVSLSLCDSCALSAVSSSTAEVLGGKRACVWSVHL